MVGWRAGVVFLALICGTSALAVVPPRDIIKLDEDSVPTALQDLIDGNNDADRDDSKIIASAREVLRAADAVADKVLERLERADEAVQGSVDAVGKRMLPAGNAEVAVTHRRLAREGIATLQSSLSYVDRALEYAEARVDDDANAEEIKVLAAGVRALKVRSGTLEDRLRSIPTVSKLDCTPRVSMTRHPTADASPNGATLERLDMLEELRPYVLIPSGCKVVRGALVSFEVLKGKPSQEVDGDDALDVWSAGEAYPVQRDLKYVIPKPKHRAAGSMSAYEMLEASQLKKLRELEDNETPDDAVYSFSVNLRWRYCLNDVGDTIVPCEGYVDTQQQRTFNLVVGKHHDTITLSLVTQPGRFMFSPQSCEGVEETLDGALPTACAEGRENSWTAIVGGSALGVKLFWAPIPKMPWLGFFSTTLSTASVALQTALATDTGEASSQLFVSPADFAVHPIDFRLPSPVRIDIGPTVGLGLVKDGDSALRWTPMFGIAISTPLVDVFGKRFGRNGNRVRDNRSTVVANQELDQLAQDLSGLRKTMDGALREHVRAGGDAAAFRGRADKPCAILEEFKYLKEQATAVLGERADDLSSAARLQSLDTWWSTNEDRLKGLCEEPKDDEEPKKEEEPEGTSETDTPADGGDE